MKSQRRHELQQNTLALWMVRGPEWLKENASRILLGLLVVVAIILLIRRHQSSVQATTALAEANLADARSIISRMKGQVQSFNTGGIGAEEAKNAHDLARKVIEEGPTPQLKAHGYVALGDYFLALAHTPPSPTAGGVDVEQSLSDAGDAYNKVLSDYKDQPMEDAIAQFGLATIEEDQGFDQLQSAKNPATAPSDHWTKAREHLEAVANDDKVLDVVRDEAKLRIEQLPNLQRRVIIAAATPSTRAAWTMPATMPHATTATSGPTTAAAVTIPLPERLPTTAPAAFPMNATTRPASR